MTSRLCVPQHAWFRIPKVQIQNDRATYIMSCARTPASFALRISYRLVAWWSIAAVVVRCLSLECVEQWALHACVAKQLFWSSWLASAHRYTCSACHVVSSLPFNGTGSSSPYYADSRYMEDVGTRKHYLAALHCFFSSRAIARHRPCAMLSCFAVLEAGVGE